VAIVEGEGYVKVHILSAPQLKNVPTIQLGAINISSIQTMVVPFPPQLTFK